MCREIAIVGSRKFPELGLVKEKIEFSYSFDLLITGGANGVDKTAENYAKAKDIPVKVIEPKWDKYGKSAGPRRNQKIVDESCLIVAFWDGESNGTKDTINKAVKASKPVDIFIR